MIFVKIEAKIGSMDGFNWIPEKGRSRAPREPISTRVYEDSRELFEIMAGARDFTLSEFLAKVLDRYAEECVKHYLALREKFEREQSEDVASTIPTEDLLVLFRLAQAKKKKDSKSDLEKLKRPIPVKPGQEGL